MAAQVHFLLQEKMIKICKLMYISLHEQTNVYDFFKSQIFILFADYNHLRYFFLTLLQYEVSSSEMHNQSSSLPVYRKNTDGGE